MNNYISPSKVKSFAAVAVYFIMQSMFQGFLVSLYVGINIDTEKLSEKEAMTELYKVVPEIMFITLIATLAIIVAIFGKDLLKQIKLNLKNKWTYVYPLILVVIYFTLAIILGIIQNKLSPNLAESENNQALFDIFNNGNKSVYLINVIIMAPVVEELVFRYSLVNFFSNKIKKLNWLPYLISAVVFALIHESTLVVYGLESLFAMFTTYTPKNIVVIDELLQFCSYLIPALPLTFGYMFTKRNIVSSIFLHIIINVVATIAMLVTM